MAFTSVWRFFLTQATAFDMRRVADALQLLFPRVKVVSLQAVAAHTRESLTKQASLVTKENKSHQHRVNALVLPPTLRAYPQCRGRSN